MVKNQVSKCGTTITFLFRILIRYSGIIGAYVSLLCMQTVILSVTYLLCTLLFHLFFLMVIVPTNGSVRIGPSNYLLAQIT